MRKGMITALLSLVVCAAAVNAQSATICKDGSTSAAAGRGACSGHGGVNKSATKAASKTAKREVKAAKAATKRTAGAQVTTICADGSTSNATGRGACSGHGGVKGAKMTSKTSGQTIPVPATSVTPKSTPSAATTRPRRTTASTGSGAVGNGSKDDANPNGAIAQCKDGLYSHAVNHQGACGHHGGVARWM